MKIVIGKRHGISLTDEQKINLAKIKGVDVLEDVGRTDSDFVKMVEKMGDGRLFVVNVPDDVKWFVNEYGDGEEFIEECHRIWNSSGELIVE